MRRLAAAFGIDYDQWRALTITALKLDLRQSSLGQPQGLRGAKGRGALIGQAVFYTMFGVFMAVAVWVVRDVLLVATVLAAYTTFIVGTVVLLDHNSALTSPVDYPVLGFRPISSRTYFAAKLTNVLVYTTGVTTLAVYLPVIAMFVRHGIVVGLAGLLALYLCSLSTALALLFAYAAMLRWFGADAIKRALSYVQLLMSFLVYGGYFVLSQMVSQAAMRTMTMPDTPLMLVFPPVWFASYVAIATGRIELTTVAPAIASVVALGAMVAGLSGRLSLDYSERLGALASASAARRQAATRPSGPGWWFRSGEGRSMALLIRSQFRNDQRFRMSVLAILPITLLYAFMGLREGRMVDPFSGTGGGPPLMIIAALLFPSMLKMSLTHSDAYRASWIFFACPADRARVLMAAKRVLVAFFLVPYLVFLTAVYIWIVGHPLHVVVHMVLIGLVSHIALQAVFLVDPELPFARPPMKQRSSGAYFAVIISTMILGSILQALSPLIYSRVAFTAVAFGAVIALTVLLDLLIRARAGQQMRQLEFQG
ncbi:MAG: hypothetical protein R2752_17600 [Vicinamibacterales bacterium]